MQAILLQHLHQPVSAWSPPGPFRRVFWTSILGDKRLGSWFPALLEGPVLCMRVLKSHRALCFPTAYVMGDWWRHSPCGPAPPASNSDLLQSNICSLYQRLAKVLAPKSPSTANCPHSIFSAPLFPCYSGSLECPRAYTQKRLSCNCQLSGQKKMPTIMPISNFYYEQRSLKYILPLWL